MIRHPSVLIMVSLLGACVPAPASVTPSTSASSEITRQIEREALSIDEALPMDTKPQTIEDATENETAVAYRLSGVIRKVVVARQAPSGWSMIQYYFGTDGALLFAKEMGRQIQRDAIGRVVTETNRDAMYYMEKGVLVAIRSASGYLLQGTTAQEQEVKGNAAKAVARFAH
jgi:hypothetical protein